MKRHTLFLILFTTAGTLELASELFESPFLHFITKPVIMLSLIGYFAASVQMRPGVLIAAMLFCWAGDVLLLFQSRDEMYFIGGLVAFLMGHILYIITYRQFRFEETKDELMVTQKIRFSLPIVLAATGLVVVLFPKLGALKFPVIIYAIVLMLMAMNALFRFARTSASSFWLVFSGAILFMISDSLLAINKFLNPIYLGGFWVMLTYVSAQFLIVKGLIKHSS